MENKKKVAVKHYECVSPALCVGSIVSIPEADQKEWKMVARCQMRSYQRHNVCFLSILAVIR